MHHKAASDLLQPEGILEDKPDQNIVRSAWNACIAQEAFRGEMAEYSSCKAASGQQQSSRAKLPTISCC